MSPRLLDILADQSFAEVGQPQHVTDDAAHGLLVVAGDLGYSQWFGYGALTRSHPRVGVYDREDLSVRHVAQVRSSVNDIAIHPSGTLVAVGTGSYDGGYTFRGQLVIMDLARGAVTSVLREPRQVCSLRWLDDTRLAMVLSPPTDELGSWDNLRSDAHEVQADWRQLRQHALDLSESTRESVPFAYPKPDLDAAHVQVRAAAARAGRPWTLRRAVWSVAGREDGSVLAACEGVAAERWSPTGGETPAWRLATAGAGRQLAPLTPTTVLTTVEIFPSRESDRFYRRSEHHLVDVVTGQVTASPTPPAGASISVVSPGSLGVLRPTLSGAEGSSDSLVLDAEAGMVAVLPLPRYDAFNHWFDITRAPAPLLLVGEEPKSHEDKWVARVEYGPQGASVHRLFPLEWQEPARHLFGGPGSFVEDGDGPAVLHCGHVHSPRGAHSPFAVRRSYPGGTVRWVVDLPGTATGADESDGVLAVTTVNGWLVLIDSLTGDKLHSVELRVRDVPVLPLSVSAYGDGRLAVGLLDGRVLRLTLADQPTDGTSRR